MPPIRSTKPPKFRLLGYIWETRQRNEYIVDAIRRRMTTQLRVVGRWPSGRRRRRWIAGGRKGECRGEGGESGGGRGMGRRLSSDGVLYFPSPCSIKRNFEKCQPSLYLWTNHIYVRTIIFMCVYLRTYYWEGRQIAAG